MFWITVFINHFFTTIIMYFKRIIKIILLALSSIIVILISCNYVIKSNSEGKLYTEVDSMPQYKYGLLLGTTPKTRIGRRTNQFLCLLEKVPFSKAPKFLLSFCYIQTLWLPRKDEIQS